MDNLLVLKESLWYAFHCCIGIFNYMVNSQMQGVVTGAQKQFLVLWIFIFILCILQ